MPFLDSIFFGLLVSYSNVKCTYPEITVKNVMMTSLTYPSFSQVPVVNILILHEMFLNYIPTKFNICAFRKKVVIIISKLYYV